MFKIPVYKAEAEAGLTKQIQANASIAYFSQVQGEEVTSKNSKFFSQGSKKFNMDILYPTKSVLVTSNWNRNDDVFGVEQIWEAKSTPIHQPTNIDHDHKKIVGHITDTWVVDDNGDLIDDATAIQDLPEIIHICNGSVIYKHSKEKDLSARAEELIEAIENNEKFVSMECLFPDFDYAVVTPEEDNWIIPRNESTAFLTKHLKAYKGEGSYEGYKLGRYIKNMIFSGKGFVDKPANPDSIIFSDDKPDFIFSDAQHKTNFIFENGVNNIMSETPQMSTTNSSELREIEMSETNDYYKNELTDAKKQITKLQEQNKTLADEFANANVEQLKSQVKDLTAEIASLKEGRDELSVKLEESEASVKSVEEKLTETTESKEKLEKAINEAKAEKVVADRVSTLVSAGLEKDKATEIVAKFTELNDDQFSDIVDVYSQTVADSTEEETNETTETTETNASDKDIDEVLDDAQEDANEEEAVGSTEAAEEGEEEQKVLESIASYFDQSLNPEDSSDK